MNIQMLSTREKIDLLLSEELVVRANTSDIEGKSRNVLYGETYDMLGVTVDSLKYYLFLEYLARLSGSEIIPTIMEADLHSIINPSINDKYELLKEGKRRVGYLRNIFERLGLENLQVLLMSEMFEKEEVGHKIVKVSELVKNSTKFQEQLSKTVLQNRIAQEKISGYRYAAEAIAVTSEFDIKVGPPREQFYDLVARELLPSLGLLSYESIYLRPSYPFTPDFSFYLTNPELEEYGLTPYKAGSNKLQDQRIILSVTPIDRAEELVRFAYLPNDVIAGNPLVDLATIVVMTRQIEEHALDVSKLGEEIRALVGKRELLVTKTCQLLGRLYE